MDGKRIIESELAKIKPPTMIAYADRGGWQHIEPYGDVGDIYVLNKSTPNIIIQIPKASATTARFCIG